MFILYHLQTLLLLKINWLFLSQNSVLLIRFLDLSKHANTVLNKQTITKIHTMFPYYFYEFLEYNKKQVLQMIKNYF